MELFELLREAAPVMLRGAGVTLMLAVMGLGVGPTLVTLYSLAGQRSPVGRSATIMTVLGSAVALSQSLSAAVTGAVAEAFGARTAMVLPFLAAGVVVGLGVLNLVIERRARRAPVGSLEVPRALECPRPVG